MAKAAKRRKKEEDEAFVLPEFDEVAYMKKEINAARISFVLIGLAVPLAVLLWAGTVIGLWGAGFLVALAFTFFLPRILAFLPWPKVDVSQLERRDWIGHGGTFFFTWLAFWILLLNVPFSDLTNPAIVAVSVNGNAIDPGGVQNSFNVTAPAFLNVTVFENVGLRSVDLVLDNGTFPLSQVQGPRWSRQLWIPARFDDATNATIVAEDTSGRTAEFAFNLALS